MSVCRKLPDGTIQKIAGHTILLDANVSEIRTGTWSLTRGSAGTMVTNITFTDPMPDTDYVVILEPSNQYNWQAQNPGPIGISGKTTTGFTLSSYAFSSVVTFNGKYTAFKPIKLDGYTELQNKVNNPDSTPTEDSLNFVTSGGVYDAISSASKIFINSESAWNALDAETKATYQVAILTDKPTVNAVDSTNGNTTVVANKNLVFKGTLDEWEALTTAQKKTYDQALITNDTDTGEVVNAVTDGDMRAVTSNAVYDALMNITTLTPTKTANVGTVYETEFLRIGRLVFVNLNLIVSSGILFTGLPKPTSRQTFTINGFYEQDKALRLIVNTDGSIETDNSSAITNQNVGGHIVYITADN